MRLTRKLARQIDGIDLSNYDVGDLIELPERKARVLIAEGWALAERRQAGPSRILSFFRRSTDRAADREDESKAS